MSFIVYAVTAIPHDQRPWVYKVHRATGYERLHQDGYTFGVRILRDNGTADFINNAHILITRNWQENPATQVITDMP